MDEPGERAAARAVLEVELDLDDAVAGAHRVDRHADLHAEPVRERQHVFERGTLSARCPEIGARVRRPPVRVRIAQRAKPSASPKPPPTRLEKIATATSASPRGDRVGERPSRAAESPRSPSHRTKTDLRPGSRPGG